ncbi:MAG: GH25 family lysozyme [Acetivibrio sp.]
MKNIMKTIMKTIGTVILFGTLFTLIPSALSLAATSPSKIKGIDVSSYNGEVDWEAVAAQGYTFAMIRIAEGQAPDVDVQFEANYSGAKSVGLKVGVYHDCCIRTPEDAALEAAYCLELLDGRELDYPVAYDIEKDKNEGGSFSGGIKNTTALAKAFCDAIKDAGYIPMIYSTARHLQNDFDWEVLSPVKVWVAHYDTETPSYDAPYDMWQYTNSASVTGANIDKGHCDLNYSFLENQDLKLTITKKTLKKNETYQINTKPSSLRSDYSFSYKVDDKSIAAVSKNGNVRGKKKGTALITVTSFNGRSAVLKVIVK